MVEPSGWANLKPLSFRAQPTTLSFYNFFSFSLTLSSRYSVEALAVVVSASSPFLSFFFRLSCSLLARFVHPRLNPTGHPTTINYTPQQFTSSLLAPRSLSRRPTLSRLVSEYHWFHPSHLGEGGQRRKMECETEREW